jgi:6-phosphogluconolactonase
MKQFDSKQELEKELATAIAHELKKAIKEFGNARLLLSGGSTPANLYNLLSGAQIDWSNVLVGLVDERFVPIAHPGSNEALLIKTIQQNEARDVRIVSMVVDASNVAVNLVQVNKAYQPFMERTDVVVLGMGEDGHTASLFPGDEQSEALLNGTANGIFSTIAPVDPTNRITCSKELLLNAPALFLMIVGENKLTVYNKAATNKYPISYFQSNLVVYYAIK